MFIGAHRKCFLFHFVQNRAVAFSLYFSWYFFKFHVLRTKIKKKFQLSSTNESNIWIFDEAKLCAQTFSMRILCKFTSISMAYDIKRYKAKKEMFLSKRNEELASKFVSPTDDSSKDTQMGIFLLVKLLLPIAIRLTHTQTLSLWSIFHRI